MCTVLLLSWKEVVGGVFFVFAYTLSVTLSYITILFITGIIIIEVIERLSRSSFILFWIFTLVLLIH